MTTEKRNASQEDLIKLARTDPGSLYDADYYETGCSDDGGHAYGRTEQWTQFFGHIAKEVDRLYDPKTVMDAGCAFGLLVEQFVDRGIDAYGFDISPYAIDQARKDIVGRVKEGSILEDIEQRAGSKYDILICIEVLEHLPPEQAEIAVDKICGASDRIIFSSSPDDFDEVTHFNVLPTKKWMEMFAERGFHPGDPVEATYIAPQARVVENANAPKMPKQSWLRGRKFKQ
ncbi:MAG: methyltransferase domain-containing protein [Paracoccaceae bacterium]